MKDKDEKVIKELLGNDFEEFKIFTKARWVGPVEIDDLLDNCLSNGFIKPPDSDSVYVVSRKPWDKRPSQDCTPLYVGSNTGKSARFRERIGDLVADMFGFFYHHSGGQSIYGYCKKENLNPKKLYIGWLEKCGCTRCAEYYFWEELQPELNIKTPPKCKQHTGKDIYSAIIP